MGISEYEPWQEFWLGLRLGAISIASYVISMDGWDLILYL